MTIKQGSHQPSYPYLQKKVDSPQKFNQLKNKNYHTPPLYCTDDHGQLLWNPSRLDDNTVSSYLSSVSEVIHSREGLPGAPVERDNEDALCLLVNSQYDSDKALNKYREGAFDCKG